MADIKIKRTEETIMVLQDYVATEEIQSTKGKKHLNDLSGKDWLIHSKSVFMDNIDDRSLLLDEQKAINQGVMLSQAPPRDDLKKAHPATFSEKDVAKLIRFFTKTNEVVLDPFLGSGSTAIASMDENRRCVGFELYKEWFEIAKKRTEKHGVDNDNCTKPFIAQSDSLSGMRQLDEQSIDFIVTSPPYWGILDKKDHKAKKERIANGLATKYGDNEADLANTGTYVEFLDALELHFLEYHRLLKDRKYAAVIVSDFRHKQRYYLFHANIAERMEKAGFTIQGVVNLVQDNKKLYPYGYPTTYVSNISNQFVVIGRKL